MAVPGASVPSGVSPDERAEIVRVARDLAFDDYLAALLAPPGAREDLLTLAAYAGEISRIPLQVSEAALGEIRLQWWRDALKSEVRSGHPVADALNSLKVRAGLPLDILLVPLEARAAELYPEPFPDDAAFRGYLEAVERAHLKLRAHVLGRLAEPALEELRPEAARVLGIIRYAVRLPYLLAKGRTPIDVARLGALRAEDTDVVMDESVLRRSVTLLIGEAAEGLSAIRPKIRHAGRAARQAMLPLALAGPYLRVLQGTGHDVLRDVAEPTPLVLSVRLWRAARLGWF
jgi:phytoene synthase